MKKLIYLFVVALLTGCATPGRLVHYPPKTQEEFNRDSYDCKMTNWATTRQVPSNTPPLILIDALFGVEEKAYRDCMQQKYGYQLFAEEMEFLQKGDSAYDNGDFNQAIADYTKCIKKNPKNRTAYENRAAAYIKIEKYAEAQADIKMFKKIGGVIPPELIAALEKAQGESLEKKGKTDTSLPNQLRQFEKEHYYQAPSFVHNGDEAKP